MQRSGVTLQPISEHRLWEQGKDDTTFSSAVFMAVSRLEFNKSSEMRNRIVTLNVTISVN